MTRERSQLITDDAWYGSRFFNEYVRQSRLNHVLWGFGAVGRAGCDAHGMSLIRRSNEPNFTAKERAVLTLLLQEIGISTCTAGRN